jgi:Transposase IS66 family
VLFTTVTTEWSLPGRKCPCCGKVTIAPAPPGAHAGSVAYGPALNAAAIVLTAHANVPPEKAAQVIGMLLGVPVSAGWVDKAASRLARQLAGAGFEDAMEAALAAEGALAADETPVSVLGKAVPAAAAGPDKDEADPGEEGKAPAGASHVLAVRTLDERLTWLRPLASRRKGHVTGGIPARFKGVLITDGYRAYQGLLSRIAGIQQCCAHVIRRCRAVLRLGPGSLQSWAGDVITVLREAHQAVEDARARGDTALDRELLDGLLERYDKAAAFGQSTTGSGTGTRAITPAGPWPRGCRASGSRSGCSPATSPSPGRATPPSGPSRRPSGTRPSPATGTPWKPSAAGASSAAISPQRRTTASLSWTPSAPPSREGPGCHHSPPLTNPAARHP